ncbi:MAG: hypothetical protein KAQ87_00940 [Candidatus Pacebacteria bacterium]|nr:hypothetical protein [Candidatus Paceibacterota bacterium]
MKKIFLIVIIFVVIAVTFLFTVIFLDRHTNNFPVSNNKKTISLNENWKESRLPYSDSVVCTLKISATTDFEKDHISGEINIDEKSTTLTFVDIDTDVPSIVGNLGDEVSLIKIDNGSTVYLIEETGFGNINVFTLFRDKNIMIMSKQYDLLGKPFGMIMMGDCLSGV